MGDRPCAARSSPRLLALRRRGVASEGAVDDGFQVAAGSLDDVGAATAMVAAHVRALDTGGALRAAAAALPGSATADATTTMTASWSALSQKLADDLAVYTRPRSITTRTPCVSSPARSTSPSSTNPRSSSRHDGMAGCVIARTTVRLVYADLREVEETTLTDPFCSLWADNGAGRRSCPAWRLRWLPRWPSRWRRADSPPDSRVERYRPFGPRLRCRRAARALRSSATANRVPSSSMPAMV